MLLPGCSCSCHVRRPPRAGGVVRRAGTLSEPAPDDLAERLTRVLAAASRGRCGFPDSWIAGRYGRSPGAVVTSGVAVGEAIRARRRRCPRSGVLDRDPLDDVRDVLGLVDRRFEQGVDVLPPDEVDRILVLD